MCSIAGIFSKRDESVHEQALQMLSNMRNRGPDSFGIKAQDWEDHATSINGISPKGESSILLGHCLLSTTGYCEQPISKGRISISHNGQIYNFSDFAQGAKVASDSESIADFFAKGLERKNLDPLAKEFTMRALGEFSIGALYNGRLYAFRDYLGLKPLWFGENSSVYAFASTPLALMKIDIQFPQPLLPGHLLEISEKGIVTRKLYSLEEFRASLKNKKISKSDFKGEFLHAIDLQTKNLKKAAVLFSGGVDSALVAKAVSERVKNVELFVAGVKGSEDIKNAQGAAKSLGLRLNKKILSEKEIASLAMKSAKTLSQFDEMQLGLAVPEIACAREISKKGFRVVFSGQGSDEVFCGYSQYAVILREKGASYVEDEIYLSLSRMWSRNFYRDDAIFSSHSLELRLPFMMQNFLAASMKVPAAEKIKSENDILRKHPVRDLARSLGLSEEIASRKKKAMQYGSGSQKIVSRLFG